MQVKINESVDSFRVLREGGFYYVDKSLMLKEFLEDNFKSSVLFARPRRFGKTMTMTMFRDFLDIRQDSREFFQGLKIMEHPDVVRKYMNQYPVVFLSLKELFGSDFESVFESLQIAISKAYGDHDYLLESPKIARYNKNFFEQLLAQEAKKTNTEQALDLLCQMLNQHYQKPAFVIIDEYDVPMVRALETPFYDDVRQMIERTLRFVCKTNPNVKAVLLSGCLYTVKNSTYTGVNNIVPFTVLSPAFASGIGFTDPDVRQLLADAGFPERYEEVKEWYDGYLFGRERMYCPWDVMRYVSSLKDGSYSKAMGPKSYWPSTSETSQNLIHGFLGKANDTNENFEQLLAGKTINCQVNESVPYHQIHENGDNLWSALLETGYLSTAGVEEMASMPLHLPNRSVEAAFRQEVWDFFRDKVDNAFVRDFISALWAGEEKLAEAAISQILEATLSFYHKYHEYSYHLILDGFFTGMGYRVISELESGYGRSDLIILDPGRSRSLVLELKHVDEEKKMLKALGEACSQLIREKYGSFLVYHGYTTRLNYACAFWDKKALIKTCMEK